MIEKNVNSKLDKQKSVNNSQLEQMNGQQNQSHKDNISSPKLIDFRAKKTIFEKIMICLVILGITGLLSSYISSTFSVRDANHLVFLSDGNIQLWEPNAGKVETLLTSDIVKYSLSEDARKLIAVRHITFEPDSYEFVLLDLETGDSQVFGEAIYCLHNFAISPDGEHLLYVADQWNLEEEDCQTEVEKKEDEVWHTYFLTASFSSLLGGTIYVVNLNNFATRTVGDCKGYLPNREQFAIYSLCTYAHWVPDSQHIIWFDAYGIWLADLELQQATMLYDLFEEDDHHLYN